MCGVVIKQYGSPSVLEFVRNLSTASLVLKDNQVLVHLHAATINESDIKIRNGDKKAIYWLSFPHILGKDGAGVVVDAGKKVSKFSIGQRVFGTLRNEPLSVGTYSEYAIFEEDHLCALDDELTFEEAAPLGSIACTIYQAFDGLSKLSSESTIFINGADLPVGLAAAQVAKNVLGATVYARGKNTNVLLNYGITDVMDLELKKLSTVVKKPLDLVIDLLGDAYDKVWGFMKKTGKFVQLNPLPRSTKTSDLLKFTIDWFGNKLNSLVFSEADFTIQVTQPNGKQMEWFQKLIKEKKVKITIQQVFPLNKIIEAHTMFENQHLSGKIVLDIVSLHTKKKKEPVKTSNITLSQESEEKKEEISIEKDETKKQEEEDIF